MDALFWFFTTTPSTFFRYKIYKKYGLYNSKYTIAGDFEFFVRIFLKKMSFKIINENFILMKSGGKSSNSLKSNFVSSREIIKSFKDNKLNTNWLFVIWISTKINSICK